MTFRNQPLDRCISDGAVGGPEFLTIISQNEGGNETRDSLRSQALGSWDVSYAARREARWRPLRAFFLVVGGRRDTWPFRDPLDYICDTDDVVLTTLSASTRQIYKRYRVGGLTYDKKIVLPVSPITVLGSGSYTVDYTTGIITINAGAAPTGVATFEFYKLCRFDTDAMKARQVTHKRDGTMIVEWAGIPIVEVLA